MTTKTRHAIQWFVYAGGQKLRRTAKMRGSWDGYDAECSCGWKSRTGGAVERSVRNMVWEHKLLAAHA